jgi:hypothetical protein
MEEWLPICQAAKRIGVSKRLLYGFTRSRPPLRTGTLPGRRGKCVEVNEAYTHVCQHARRAPAGLHQPVQAPALPTADAQAWADLEILSEQLQHEKDHDGEEPFEFDCLEIRVRPLASLSPDVQLDQAEALGRARFAQRREARLVEILLEPSGRIMWIAPKGFDGAGGIEVTWCERPAPGQRR